MADQPADQSVGAWYETANTSEFELNDFGLSVGDEQLFDIYIDFIPGENFTLNMEIVNLTNDVEAIELSVAAASGFNTASIIAGGYTLVDGKVAIDVNNSQFSNVEAIFITEIVIEFKSGKTVVAVTTSPEEFANLHNPADGDDDEEEEEVLPTDWNTMENYVFDSLGNGEFIIRNVETGKLFEDIVPPWYMNPDMIELSVREDGLVLVNIETAEEFVAVEIEAEWIETSAEGYTLDVTMTRTADFVKFLTFHIHFREKRYDFYGGGTSRNTDFSNESESWYFEDKNPRYPVEKYLIWAGKLTIGRELVTFRDESYNDEHWSKIGNY